MSRCFQLYIFGQISNQVQLVQCSLVYVAHTVIYEATTQQYCQSENSHVMILTLIEGAQSLSVNYEHLYWLSLRCGALYWLSP